MCADVLILRSSILLFNRAYGEKTLENLDLTGGFLSAIAGFSQVEVGENLEAVNMSDSLFYFYTKDQYTFILREERSSATTREQVARILKQLSAKFFQEFPNIDAWEGNLDDFTSFTTTCDKILQARPTRKGFPILYQVALQPFFLAPLLHVVPVVPEHENCLYELQYHLRRYMEQIGIPNLATLSEKSFLLYLPRCRHLAYAYAFGTSDEDGAISHFLCYLVEEEVWFAFYQVMSLFFRRAQHILPQVANYLALLDTNPSFSDVNHARPFIQDLIEDWADLNQYISVMSAMLSDQFFKSSIKSTELTEDQVRAHFMVLLTRVGSEFDRVLGAALSLRQVLFVGTEQESVEQVLGAFLAYYPHPSVVMWAETVSDALFVGTRPDLVQFYDPSTVIIDLVNNAVIGGEKNEFCADLLVETLLFAQETSFAESRRFFQSEISEIFTQLKTALELLALEEPEQQRRFREMISKYPPDSIQLLTQISEKLNPFLAKTLRASQ